MDKTMEQRVAEAMLQQPDKVKIGNRTYTVARPTVATLIMASAAIAELPQFELDKEITNETVMRDVLREAKSAEGVGDVIAIMIVGAKGMNGSCFSRWFKQRKIKRMKRLVLENLGAYELGILAKTLFAKLHVGDFFGLIAFLSEVNMTKPTKATTTASGQPSELS